MNELAGHLFVGFTTEQNTANLVPAVQFGARRYLAIDTTRAAREGWGDGLVRVLQGRGVAVDVPLVLLSADEGSLPGVLGDLEGRVSGEEGVVWLLGGGQKHHQLASWSLFLQRVRRGLSRDIALYADPERSQVVRLAPDDKGRIVESVQPLRTDLSIEEVLACYGRQVRKSQPLRPPLSDEANEVVAFRNDQDLRRRWWTLGASTPRARAAATVPRSLLDWNQLLVDEGKPHFRALSYQWLERSHGAYATQRPEGREGLAWSLAKRVLDVGEWIQVVEPLGTPTQPPTNAFGVTQFKNWFERALQAVAADRLKDRSVSGFANAVVARIANPTVDESEHDVLLLHPQGILHSLDAKTFDVEEKDLNSRLFNLGLSGGRLSRYVIVLPCFLDDQDFVPREQRRLPFALAERRQTFAVLGPDERSFWIRWDAPNERAVAARDGEADAVRCTTVEDWLDARFR